MKDTLIASGLILLCLLTCSCRKESPNAITNAAVTGLVQKGPYANGTSISLYELNSSLEQTGKVFTSQITDNEGSFTINNISLISNFVELSAIGYYFDEVTGALSMAPLNLYALSDIQDLSTINVNILTHLEKQRVDYLIKNNMSFSEAKKQSQAEILAIFGFTALDMDNSEALDISIDNEGNAILLAISVIFQGYRSVGDLTELLATVANDISTDGVINNIGTIESLRKSAIEIDLPGIRQNLESRYETLGITASIPGFEKYVTDFIDFSVFAGKKPEATTDLATYIAADSSLLNGTVNANSISTTVAFEYGTDDNYGNSVIASQSPLNSMYALHVGAVISGLTPATTYHYRVGIVLIQVLQTN